MTANGAPVGAGEPRRRWRGRPLRRGSPARVATAMLRAGPPEVVILSAAKNPSPAPLALRVGAGLSGAGEAGRAPRGMPAWRRILRCAQNDRGQGPPRRHTARRPDGARALADARPVATQNSKLI